MKFEMICKLHILNGILEQNSVGKVQQKYFQFGQFARGDLYQEIRTLTCWNWSILFHASPESKFQTSIHPCLRKHRRLNKLSPSHSSCSVPHQGHPCLSRKSSCPAQKFLQQDSLYDLSHLLPDCFSWSSLLNFMLIVNFNYNFRFGFSGKGNLHAPPKAQNDSYCHSQSLQHIQQVIDHIVYSNIQYINTVSCTIQHSPLSIYTREVMFWTRQTSQQFPSPLQTWLHCDCWWCTSLLGIVKPRSSPRLRDIKVINQVS